MVSGHTLTTGKLDFQLLLFLKHNIYSQSVSTCH